MKEWHYHLTHMNIHKDWLRNVYRKYGIFPNFIPSLVLIEFHDFVPWIFFSRMISPLNIKRVYIVQFSPFRKSRARMMPDLGIWCAITLVHRCILHEEWNRWRQTIFIASTFKQYTYLVLCFNGRSNWLTKLCHLLSKMRKFS